MLDQLDPTTIATIRRAVAAIAGLNVVAACSVARAPLKRIEEPGDRWVVVTGGPAMGKSARPAQ